MVDILFFARRLTIISNPKQAESLRGSGWKVTGCLWGGFEGRRNKVEGSLNVFRPVSERK
jgi:hypothetical protein